MLLFVTAIPDNFYFTWQVEIQLYNFSSLGINPENVHVLIAYEEKHGLSAAFESLIQRLNGKAVFHLYPDKRSSKIYESSVRPYLMKEHLKRFPFLEKENLFYYDTDIIFRQLPDFESLLQDDNWYTSDTIAYIGSSYLKKEGGRVLFSKMCSTVGIEESIVENNEKDSGGAQYLLKRTTAEFWEKVEADSTALFELLEYNNNLGAEAQFLFQWMLSKGKSKLEKPE